MRLTVKYLFPFAVALALLTAAMMGTNEMLEVLITRGADIQSKDKSGLTGLMWAAQYGRVETVKFLLDHGADANPTFAIRPENQENRG